MGKKVPVQSVCFLLLIYMYGFAGYFLPKIQSQRKNQNKNK